MDWQALLSNLLAGIQAIGMSASSTIGDLMNLVSQWVIFLVNFYAGWFNYILVFAIRSIALFTESVPNIFAAILDVILHILAWLILPLFGSPSDQVAAFNLAGVIGQNGAVVMEMFYTGFSVFNLTWPFIAFGAIVMLKAIQMVVAVYKFIKDLIPMM